MGRIVGLVSARQACRWSERPLRTGWRKGWIWSYGFGIQQLQMVVEVKKVYRVTKGKNMGEEWRQGLLGQYSTSEIGRKRKYAKDGEKKVPSKRLAKN